jgi:hypothetical protein
VAIPEKDRQVLGLDLGEEVFLTPFVYENLRKEQR